MSDFRVICLVFSLFDARWILVAGHLAPSILRTLLLLMIGWSLSMPIAVQAETVTLKQADLLATIQTMRGTEEQQSERISLPLSWDKKFGNRSGQATLSLRFQDTSDGKDRGMYIPRLGNAYVIRLNGSEIDRYGTLPPNLYDDSARDPMYFLLPGGLIQSENVLEISVGAVGGRLGGLSRVTIGPPAQVYPLYRKTYFWQVNATQFVVVISAVLGILSLLLWIKQRDLIFLYYGLGEVFWSLQTLRALLTHPPLPWPWWGVLPLAAFNLACPLLIKFAMAVMGQSTSWVNHLANITLVLAIPAALLTMLAGIAWVVPVFQALLILMCVGMLVKVIPFAIDARVSERRVMASAVSLVVVCAVRDFLTLRFAEDTYAMIPWTRFAWVAFGVSMAWIIAERMRSFEIFENRAKKELEARLAQRDQELSVAFERDRQAVKEIGATQERTRLMRDLHDGLGSHLVGALRIAQRADASKEDLAAELREAIDQLKITVDASQETDGDVAAILGAVRYRMGARLEASGITLIWDVARLAQLEHWGVREAYHLQMLLYEAFTNMIVHSAGKRARLTAQSIQLEKEKFLHIEFIDDGQGFDIEAARLKPGKGLANMYMRAKEIGAQMDMTSRPGNTRLTLILPLNKPR